LNLKRDPIEHPKMLKKRILHRIVMVDTNKVIIIGGYNYEEGTLNSVELFTLDVSKNVEEYRKRDGSNLALKYRFLRSLVIPRQNFGITTLKNNPNNLDNPMDFLKIVVACGYNGKQYVNSIEIYDIKEDKWTLYSCSDNSLIRSSYIGLVAFLNEDVSINGKEEKEGCGFEEAILIFGGQAKKSDAESKLLEAIDDVNNKDFDLDAEKEKY